MKDGLREKVAEIDWWHTIDLGNGIITPGRDNSPERLKKIGMPQDLTGHTVLDIGAANGFYSFEAERRGAKRVVAADQPLAWNANGHPKRGFELARKALNSKVEDVVMDVYDMSPKNIGTFDLVLFLGVLYHLQHPLLALEHVFSVTSKQLILETHVDMLHFKRPAMAFYPNAELDGDASNWWGPNPVAVEEMLKTVGFTSVKRISQSRSQAHKLGAALALKIKNGTPYFQTLQQNRMVFHAWKEK